MRVLSLENVVMLIIKVRWFVNSWFCNQREVKTPIWELQALSPKHPQVLILQSIVNVVQRSNQVLIIEDKTRLNVISKKDTLNTSTCKF